MGDTEQRDFEAIDSNLTLTIQKKPVTNGAGLDGTTGGKAKDPALDLLVEPTPSFSEASSDNLPQPLVYFHGMASNVSQKATVARPTEIRMYAPLFACEVSVPSFPALMMLPAEDEAPVLFNQLSDGGPPVEAMAALLTKLDATHLRSLKAKCEEQILIREEEEVEAAAVAAEAAASASASASASAIASAAAAAALAEIERAAADVKVAEEEVVKVASAVANAEALTKGPEEAGLAVGEASDANKTTEASLLATATVADAASDPNAASERKETVETTLSWLSQQETTDAQPSPMGPVGELADALRVQGGRGNFYNKAWAVMKRGPEEVTVTFTDSKGRVTSCRVRLLCPHSRVDPDSHRKSLAVSQAKDVLATNPDRYEFDIVTDETKVTKNGALAVVAYHIRCDTLASYLAWTQFTSSSQEEIG